MNERETVLPPRQHHCNPGWVLRHSNAADHPLGPHNYWHDLQLPVGTMLRCKCGVVWIAGPPATYANAISFAPVWRRARRRERKRFLAARGADTPATKEDANE